MSITLTCDHCEKFQCTYDGAEDPTKVIMWCKECIDTDYAEIDKVGLRRDYGPSGRFIWVRSESIKSLKSVPKRNKAVEAAPIVETPVSVRVIEKKPCSRAYYGLPECTCGTCPPKRRLVNTNPFRYGL